MILRRLAKFFECEEKVVVKDAAYWQAVVERARAEFRKEEPPLDASCYRKKKKPDDWWPGGGPSVFMTAPY